jgi:hypothetical protein
MTLALVEDSTGRLFDGQARRIIPQIIEKIETRALDGGSERVVGKPEVLR